MTTTITPPDSPTTPPTPPVPPQPGDGPAPAPRSSARVVAIIAICLGAVLVLGTVATGILSIVRNAAARTTSYTAAAEGLRGLDLDVSAADVTVVYGGGREATLSVTGGDGVWTFERSGDTLVVSSDRQWWGRWGWFRDADKATLTLPLRAEGLDADIDVNGGSLSAQGGYGDLDLTLDAGSMQVTGRAETLTTEVNAGSARLDVGDVESATLSVNAGSLEGRLGETLGMASPIVPGFVSIDVSAGRVDLTLPDSVYAITSDVSAGSFSHDLDEGSDSQHRIGVTVSAGSVILRSAG